MSIPESYKQFCNSPAVESCEWYMHDDCIKTCGMAQRIKKGISHLSKTGMERFLEKYPNYKEQIGIGAMVVPLDNGGDK